MTISMQRPKLWFLAASIALAVIAIATAREGGAAETGASASAAKAVQIKGFAFKPATLAVNRGARVTFANSSGVPHTATGSSFDTKRISPGKSATVRFDKRGTFAYHCKIHPEMRGRVIVE